MKKKSTKRRLPRFGLKLRTKIMLMIIAVGVSVFGVAFSESYSAHLGEGRGRFLRKHYQRFDAYRNSLGQNLGAVAHLSASMPDVVQPLANDDSAAARAGFERVAQAVQEALDPDLVLFVDRNNRPITVPGASRLDARETTRSALVRDVLAGMAVESELAVLGGVLYQVSGQPIRKEGEVLGAIIFGVRMDRYFDDYRRQSDRRRQKQHLLSFVTHDGRVLATVFPEENRADLGESVQPQNWGEQAEGAAGDMVPVAVVGDTMYDLWADMGAGEEEGDGVVGYDGADKHILGNFYLLRTRQFKEDQLTERLTGSAYSLLATLLFTIFAGFLMSWMITRRVDRYVEATEDIAQGQGDLTKRLDAGQADELGLLADNLNAVFSHTHDLAARVQRAAFQVGASSAEISAASKQMLDGAQEQARKTESSTAAVTELSTSIQQVAENANEASVVAKDSGEAVSKAIERMEDIRGTVDEAASRIGELGESSKRIGNIVEVIRQISDQTTLLALNAAIEAAHAGEQGRGFAVVADEVSGLAKRVGQSARDIEDLIATIREQTSEAVRAMDAGKREVEEGTKLVHDTLGGLQTLVQVVGDTATSVREQAVASDEIARNMDDVQRIAQDVLGASEEAVEQGEHLHRLAHDLEESVKGFRIDPSAIDDGPDPLALPAGNHDDDSE